MIVLLFLTYNRMSEATITLEAAAKNLRASEDIWLHIADDGSTQDYRDELLDLARSLYGERVSISNSERSGYGGNYNAATQVVHNIADLILPLEDDWELLRELDLDPIAKVLRAGYFNCVRLGYIGYTKELRSTLRWHGNLHWLEFDPESSEKHIWTGGPRLETVEFQRNLGPWPDHMEQGQTELEVCGRIESKTGIAWPIDIISIRGDAFVHIGTYKAGFEPKLEAQPVKGSVSPQAVHHD
ncbi:hypothetical protein LCGC14_0936240 [marine sediment metagenome]|uniref:Glycosyltransferase 2-like domain-containing protein n=1 Tax=marine sediment metagenome TaxID=412755 RepID=A0A0F9NLK1_9ZZZZ